MGFDLWRAEAIPVDAEFPGASAEGVRVDAEEARRAERPVDPAEGRPQGGSMRDVPVRQ